LGSVSNVKRRLTINHFYRECVFAKWCNPNAHHICLVYLGQKAQRKGNRQFLP